MSDPSPVPAKAKEEKKSAWAAVLQHGISGWSSYTDTGEAVDRHVEEDGEHATSAPRGSDGGSEPTKPGESKGAGLPRQGTSQDLAKKAEKAGEGDGDAGDGKEPGKDANGPGGKGKAPALDAGWKQYRKDVEWQCRWLELRMKEVGGHIGRYERMLVGIERAKERRDEKTGGGADADAEKDQAEDEKQKQTPNSEPKASDPKSNVSETVASEKANKMKRRRTRDASAPPPPSPVLVAHPLFDETKRGGGGQRAGGVKTNGGKGRKRARLATTDSGHHEPQTKTISGARNDTECSDSDLSTAALYEQIEVLQQRVTALHARLGQPVPAMHAGGAVASTAARASGPTGLGSKLSGLSGHGQWALGGVGPSALKKTPVSRKDDFDINNVVGAAPVGAKFVERAQHQDIQTPVVRPAPVWDPDPSGKDAPEDEENDVSSEDTSDEAFVRRHTKFEVAERVARLGPKKKKEKGGGEQRAGGGKAATEKDDADSDLGKIAHLENEAQDGELTMEGDDADAAVAG